jgi:hypothetical protein
MRSMSMRGRAGLVSVLVLLPALGCGTSPPDCVTIAGAVEPRAGSCDAPEAGGALVGRGVFDVGVSVARGAGYQQLLRVENQVPSCRSAEGGPGQGDVLLTTFEVEIDAPASQPISDLFQVPLPGVTRRTVSVAGGLIAAGRTLTVPLEIAGSELATLLLESGRLAPGPAPAGQPYQHLVARVRPAARLGGAPATSGWTSFPIDVCVFCLVRKPGEPLASGYDRDSGAPLACPDPATLGEGDLVSTCLPQQDRPSTCCAKGRELLCGTDIEHRGPR